MRAHMLNISMNKCCNKYCKSLLPHNQHRQQLATSRWLTHSTCVAGHPDWTSWKKLRSIDTVYNRLKHMWKVLLPHSLTLHHWPKHCWLFHFASSIYGIKCVGRIVTKSISYFLHFCDCSVLYCASLTAWNWFVAGQHLNWSQPRSSVWPNQNITLFPGNYFFKNFKQSYFLNR